MYTEEQGQPLHHVPEDCGRSDCWLKYEEMGFERCYKGINLNFNCFGGLKGHGEINNYYILSLGQQLLHFELNDGIIKEIGNHLSIQVFI